MSRRRKNRQLVIDGNVHFTSDQHFNHGNIIKYCLRPFLNKEELDILAKGGDFRVRKESIWEMNDTLIDLTNKYVNQNDWLICHGDFCFGDPHDFKKKRERIVCQNIVLILGNHDDVEVDEIKSYFTYVYDHPTIVPAKINGQSFWMSHYANLVWNKMHGRSKVVHTYGHSHSTLEPWLNENCQGRRSIDVGIDSALKLLGEMRPFSFDEVMDNIGNGFFADHHKGTTCQE